MTLPSQDSFSTFGGLKQDYDAIVNISTDYSAVSNLNPAFVDVSMMTRTAIRSYVRFTTSATIPTLNTYEACWREFTTTQPVLARTGTGVYTITFPTTVSDGIGDTNYVNFQSCLPKVEGNSFALVQGSITSANVLTIYTATTGGTPSDLSGTAVISVWAI